MKSNMENSFRKLIRYLLVATLALWGMSTQAVPMLTYSPTSQTVGLGSQASVDVMVTGLTGEFVGDFDFNVSWDETLLSLNSVAFDIFLDGPTDSFQFFDNSLAGTVNVVELSLGGLLNQTGFNDFRLFSLTFNTLDIGTSALDFLGNIGGDPTAFLGDGFGNLISTTTQSGSITIVSAPEPSTLLLMLLGVIGFGASRMKRKI